MRVFTKICVLVISLFLTVGVSFGEGRGSIAYYNDAIEKNPRSADLYYNRGMTYCHKTKYYLALKDFSKAIELNPNYAVAYNNRGLIYGSQTKFDIAISDFKKAFEINPNLTEAKVNLEYTHYNKELYYPQDHWGDPCKSKEK